MQSDQIRQRSGADLYSAAVLTILTILLGIIALRPATNPIAVHAQSDSPSLYVEPGTTMVRSPDGNSKVQGKVIIDLRNGNVWGFPTLSGAPYPVDPTTSKPPVSTPMYLGKFDLSKIRQAP